jgi:hypothetical protein
VKLQAFLKELSHGTKVAILPEQMNCKARGAETAKFKSELLTFPEEVKLECR